MEICSVRFTIEFHCEAHIRRSDKLAGITIECVLTPDNVGVLDTPDLLSIF